MDSVVKKTRHSLLIIVFLSVLTVTAIAVAIYTKYLPYSNQYYTDLSKATEITELQQILAPFPDDDGVKKYSDSIQADEGEVEKVILRIHDSQDSVPDSGVALSDRKSVFASGLEEINGSTHIYDAYVLKELPVGIEQKDVIRHIFLNLYFNSFGADSSFGFKERQTAFHSWLEDSTNYDEIDQQISKLTQ